MLNEEALKDDYFSNYTIDDLIDKVFSEADKLRDDFQNAGTNLENLFKPLKPDRKTFGAGELLEAKALVKDKQNHPQPILRLYGLRVSEKNIYNYWGCYQIVSFYGNPP